MPDAFNELGDREMRVKHGQIRVTPEAIDVVARLLTIVGCRNHLNWTLEGIKLLDCDPVAPKISPGVLSNGSLRLVLRDKVGNGREYCLHHEFRSGKDLFEKIRAHLNGHRGQQKEKGMTMYHLRVNRGKHDTKNVPPDLEKYVANILEMVGAPRGTSLTIWVATPWWEVKEVGWKLVSKEPNGAKVRLKTPQANSGWECILQPRGKSITVDVLYGLLAKTSRQEVEERHVRPRLEHLRGAARQSRPRRAVLKEFPRSGSVVSSEDSLELARKALDVYHLDGRAVGRLLGEIAKLGYLKQHRTEGGKVSGYSMTEQGLVDVGITEVTTEETAPAKLDKQVPEKEQPTPLVSAFEPALDELHRRMEAIDAQLQTLKDQVGKLETERKRLSALADGLIDLV